MKKHFLILVVLLLSTLNLFSMQVLYNDLWYEYYDDGTAYVISDRAGNYDYLTDVIIPENIYVNYVTYLVTHISSGAFQDCQTLKSVTIPNSVKKIGEAAFSDCSSLTSIVLPLGLEELAQFAFEGCSSLSTINIPNGITYIGDYTFSNCSSLTSLTLPNGITTIGHSAFYGCSALESINIPEGVSVLENSAFTNCYSLASIVLPSTITKIGDGVFWSCFPLSSINLPDGLTSIGMGVFSNTAINNIEIPRSLTDIHTEAFSNMFLLENIFVDEDNPNYCSIGGILYTKDKSTLIHMPAKNQSSSITIPKTATNFPYDQLYNNRQLENIFVEEGHPSYSSIDGVLYNKDQTTILACPRAKTSVSLPNSLTSIGKSAFHGCLSIESISIPGSVNQIGDYAFYQCTALKSVNLPDGLTNLSRNVFSSCSSLKAISLPSTLTTISDQVFVSCTSLDSINIPESLTYIGSAAFLHTPWLSKQKDSDGAVYINRILYQYGSENEQYAIKEGTISISGDAFAHNRKIISVSMPNSVTYMGSGAFQQCDLLKSIKISSNLISIESNVFDNCSSLSSIILPDSLKSIGSSAFSGCSALTSITIPEGVEYVSHDGVFSDCSSLDTIIWNAKYHTDFDYGEVAPFADISKQIRSITFGESVRHIPAYLCYEMSNLSSLDIPSTVESIGRDAFKGVDMRKFTHADGVIYIGSVLYGYNGKMPLNTHIIIKDGTKTISPNAFADYEGLSAITIPSSVTHIGNWAFNNCSSYRKTYYLGDIEGWCKIRMASSAIGSEFYLNNKIVRKLIIPNSVDSIYDNTFSGCSSIYSVEIPNSVRHIGESAFSGCSSLDSLTIPNSVTSIGNEAFAGCSMLQYVSLPNSITNISERAFAYCELLNSINIPTSVTNISRYAFYGCIMLDDIHIPSSVTQIDNYAFNGIPYIMVECDNNTPPTIGRDVIGMPVGRTTQYFVVSDVNKYKQAWPEYEANIVQRQDIEKEVTISANSSRSALQQKLGLSTLKKIVKLKINGSINSYDIMMIRNQMPMLRELDLSDANIVANAYEYASGYCSKNDTLTTESFTGASTNIQKMTLPYSIKYIEVGAFTSTLKHIDIYSGDWESRALNNIQHINLGDGIKHIGKEAFMGSFSSTITMGKGVETIGDFAFTYCDKLRKLVLGENVKSIGEGAFAYCKNLEGIVLPASLKSIGQNAFINCTSLHEIVLPNQLESIGNYAFQGSGLDRITLPENLLYLGVGAFAGYDLTKTRWYGETNEGMKEYNATTMAFNFFNSEKNPFQIACSGGSLREVIIPKNSRLKKIPSRAFEGNEKLTKLELLGDSITYIDELAFASCSVDTLILPPSLTKFGALAFSYNEKLKYVIMPNSLKEIPHNAFFECSNLKKVQFPLYLTSIGHDAFGQCDSLSVVDIPGLVTYIGDYAFNGCKVDSVYSYLFDPFTIEQHTFSDHTMVNGTLFVPNIEDTELKYIYDTRWSQFLNLVRVDKDFVYHDFYANNDIYIGSYDEPLNGNPNANLQPGSGLVVEGGDVEQNLGNVIVNGEAGNWASILAECNLNVDTLSLVFQVKGKKWYFMGFPFEINLSDIITDANYVIYEYDGAARAQMDTTNWKALPKHEKHLHPGRGYMIQFDFSDQGEFSINISQPKFCEMLDQVTLAVHPAAKPHNQSWNYVCNPMLAYYDINDLNFTGPITIWDMASSTYKSIRPGDDEYYLSPYEAFFLQNSDLNKDFSLIYDKNKGMTLTQCRERQGYNYIKQRRNTYDESQRYIINLSIANNTHSDMTRVVVNSNTTLAYDLGVDAAKFLSTENVPQIFTYDVEENMCAINERPMDNGVIHIGIKVPSAGNYSISALRLDTMFYLWDKQENIIHDFTNGDYHFESKSGTHSSRFALVQNQTITNTKYVEEIAVACDSYTWNGETYTQSGEYTYTTTTANSCDSIVTLYLTINQTQYATESVVACDSYTWNGETYTESGEYVYTTVAANGCDSVVTLYLTILPKAVSETEELVLCSSELPYEWYGQTVTEAGAYTATEQYAGMECDSVIHELTLNVYVQTLPEQVTLPIVRQGEVIDVTIPTGEIQAHIAEDTWYAPNALVEWYVFTNGDWAILTDEPLASSAKEIVMKYAVESDCGIVESDTITISVLTTSVENISADELEVYKVIREDKVFIIRGGKTYSILGCSIENWSSFGL